MADLLEIDVSALSADANTLDSLLSSGKVELAAMKESIAALSSTWTGAAHGTFYEQLSKDAALMEEVFAALRKYKEHMEYAVREYNQCEQDVHELVASIQV